MNLLVMTTQRVVEYEFACSLRFIKMHVAFYCMIILTSPFDVGYRTITNHLALDLISFIYFVGVAGQSSIATTDDSAAGDTSADVAGPVVEQGTVKRAAFKQVPLVDYILNVVSFTTVLGW